MPDNLTHLLQPPFKGGKRETILALNDGNYYTIPQLAKVKGRTNSWVKTRLQRKEWNDPELFFIPKTHKKTKVSKVLKDEEGSLAHLSNTSRFENIRKIPNPTRLDRKMYSKKRKSSVVIQPTRYLLSDEDMGEAAAAFAKISRRAGLKGTRTHFKNEVTDE
jgi:hypothetical protein